MGSHFGTQDAPTHHDKLVLEAEEHLMFQAQVSTGSTGCIQAIELRAIRAFSERALVPSRTSDSELERRGLSAISQGGVSDGSCSRKF
jgi:hypothetical protein